MKMVASEMVEWLTVVQMCFLKLQRRGNSTADSERFGRHMKCSQYTGLLTL